MKRASKIKDAIAYLEQGEEVKLTMSSDTAVTPAVKREIRQLFAVAGNVRLKASSLTDTVTVRCSPKESDT